MKFTMNILPAGLLLAVIAVAAPAQPVHPGPLSLPAPQGWATVHELGRDGTTGGAGGETVVVTTGAELIDYAGRAEPYVIYVQGTINPDSVVRIEEHGHKSILGIGTDATIQGEIRIRKGASNVIIRNIKFDGLGEVGDGVSIDGKPVSGSGPVHHIWVDHCDFTRYTDGPVDISHGADFVTLSWNHFHDTNRVSLVGHSNNNRERDAGHLTITYHHNWFDHTIQRHPRVRFARLVHLFNNFYDLDEKAIYGTVSTMEAHVLVENNYFKGVRTPFKSASGHASSDPGYLVARGNQFEDCGEVREEHGEVPEARDFYGYTLDEAAQVPALVTAGAGSGKLAIQAPAAE